MVHARHRTRPLRTALYAVAAAGTAVLIAACGSTARPARSAGHGAAVLAASSATISETGSSLLAPQAQTWATAYQRATPGVSVNIKSTSSGTGISAAIAGTADIGASDAYLSSGDLVQSPTLLNIALTVSAQTVIYNLPGLSQGSHVSLDGQVLAEIYDGTITMWNDSRITGLNVNKGLNLPPLKIVPLHRSGSSGDTFSVHQLPVDPGPRLEQLDRVRHNGRMAVRPRCGWHGRRGRRGEQHRDAERLHGYARLHRLQRDQLPVASAGRPRLREPEEQRRRLHAADGRGDPGGGRQLRVAHPAQRDDLDDQRAGPAGYPIVNYEYAVVKAVQPDAAKASVLRAFLRWVITTGNGSSYLKDLGFQSLSGPLVTLGEQQIAEIG